MISSMRYLLPLLLLVVAGSELSGCSAEKAGPQPDAPLVRGVTLETVRMTAVPEILEVVGSVRARTAAVVAARIPGSVSALKVREGDRVRKGQLLVVLEAGEHLAGSSGAKAAMDEAAQGVDEARARQRLADATFERYQKLYDEQALTRQEFEQKQTERDLARQGVLRAEARLRQAREGGRSAAVLADYSRITAPISGLITSRQVELGATVFPAQPLFSIEDDGSYQVDLAVPESFAGSIRPGTPVRIVLDALQTTLTTKISEIVPASDPATRTFTAKVFLSGQRGLRSGMFARAGLSLGASANRLLLPEKALFERGALLGVWVVDSTGIARMRLVKSGKKRDGRIEILSGLADGERVVVAGGEKIADGARIEP